MTASSRSRKRAYGTQPSTPSKPRAPPRCRICPDRPLKSACGCSLKRRSNGAQNASPNRTAVIPQSLSTPPAAPSQAQSTPTTPHQEAPSLSPPPRSPSEVPESDEDQDAPGTSSLPATPSTARISTRPSFLDALTVKPRVYVSDSNPVHGRITIYRGNKKYKIARLHKMKHLYSKRASATKAFDRMSREVVTRLESAAERTGGWAYLVMLHPGSRQPFLEYASHRLRRDAPEEVKAVHKSASAMMNLVKAADRSINMDAQRIQQQADEQVRQAETRVEEAQASIEAMRQENARLKASLLTRDHLLSLSKSVIEMHVGAAALGNEGPGVAGGGS